MSKVSRSAWDDIQLCDRHWDNDGADEDVLGEHHCAGLVQPGQPHECRCCCGVAYPLATGGLIESRQPLLAASTELCALPVSLRRRVRGWWK